MVITSFACLSTTIRNTKLAGYSPSQGLMVYLPRSFAEDLLPISENQDSNLEEFNVVGTGIKFLHQTDIKVGHFHSPAPSGTQTYNGNQFKVYHTSLKQCSTSSELHLPAGFKTVPLRSKLHSISSGQQLPCDACNRGTNGCQGHVAIVEPLSL